MATSFADPAGGQLAPVQQQGGGGDQTRDVQVNLGADVSAYTQQMQAAQAQTNALSGSVDKLTEKLGSLSKFAGHIMIGTGAAAGAGLAASVADAAAYEHQLGTLRATASITGASMDELKKGINDAFTSFPVARGEVVQLTEAITNLGITSPKAVSSLTNTFIKLGGATGEQPTALAQGTIQLARQAGNVTPDSVAGYSNALLTVSKNQGVAASGVLDFAQAIAPMARQAGIGTAAIEGISSAFQKAGADGAYAANTFNQIIGDITQLSKSGSPELGKYANFVGQTIGQFKQMSGTRQFTAVFEELSKGGAAANNFVQSLGLGTRAVSSVQAVVQGGGLSQAIAQAQGAATGTGALDTASKAAFGGLSNQMTMLGNQFTQLGEIIGGPLLTPLTEMAKGLTSVVSTIDKVLEPLGKLPAVLGVLGTAITTVAGVALTHAGAIGALALGRVMLGAGSGPRMGYAAGREAGRSVFAGTATEAEARNASEIGRRAGIAPGMPGYLPARMRVPYEAGLASAMRGPGFMERTFGPSVGGAFMGGFRNMARGGANLAAWTIEEQSRFLKDANLRGLDRSFYTGATTRIDWGRPGALGRLIGAGRDFTFNNLSAAGGMSADAARKLATLEGRYDPTTGQLMGPSVLRTGATAAFRGGQALGALGAVGRAAFSLPGMLALSVGLPLASSLVDKAKAKIAEPTDVEGTYNHITKFNQLLDTTSTNLARLGETAGDTGEKLSKFANAPLEQVAKITPEDVAAVTGANYKPTDQTIIDIAKKSGDSTAAMTDYLKGLVVSQGTPLTGDLLTALKRDVSAGYGPGGQATAQKAIDDLVASNKAGTLRKTFNAADMGQVANLADKDTYKSIIGGAVSTIISGTQDTGPEGVKSRIGNMINLGAASLTGNTLSPNFAPNLANFSQQMATAFGGKATDYDNTARQSGMTGKFGNDLFGTTAATKQTLAYNYVLSPEGQKALAGMGINVDIGNQKEVQAAATRVVGMANATVGLPPPVSSEEFTQLRTRGGAFGRAAAGSTAFQAAANAPEDVSRQFTQAQELVNNALKQANGNWVKAQAILMQTASAVNGADSASGALIESAAAWARTLQGFQTVTLPRADQLGVAYRQAMASSNVVAAAEKGGGTATKEAEKAKEDDAKELGNQQENYRQYMIGRLQQLKSFNKEWERNQQSYNISVSNSFRDFATSSFRATLAYNTEKGRAEEAFQNQQADAQQDYYDQRLYAQQDYQRQSSRSLDAYNTQVDRANEDHATQLARQAEQAAQSIYDPYLRIQRKATTDAGTLIQNLTDQNADIEKQQSQLVQLKKAGLSQQAIDTLDLTNPENAQQLDTLFNDLTQNPEMIKKIDALVAQRATATKTLTQSPMSRTFREGEEDFAKQMKRAREDFDKQQGYMLEDFNTANDRMAHEFDKTEKRVARDHQINMHQMYQDYKTQEEQQKADWLTSLHDMAVAHQIWQDQAAQDLLDSFIQYSGGFSSIFTQLMTAATGAIGTYVPEAGTAITKELDAINAKYPGLFAWKPGDAPPATTTPPTNATGPGGPSGYTHPEQPPAPKNEGPTVVTPGSPYQVPPGGPGQGLNLPPDPNIKPPPHTPRDPHAQTPHAAGGIFLGPQYASVAEQGPEALLPLNNRGQDFMAGLIARSLAQGITAAYSGGGSTSTNYSSDNSISFSGAEIQVIAPDPDKMAKQLAAKAKLARLTSPVRH